MKQIDDFNPRVTNVILTVCVLLVAQFCILFSNDLFREPPYWATHSFEEMANYQYLSSIGQLSWIALFGVPIMIWHACELYGSRVSSSKLTEFLSSYKLVFVLMVGGLVGTTIVFSGFIEWMQCRDNMGFCTPVKLAGVEYLVVPFALALLAVATVKTVVIIFNLLRRPR